MEFCLWCFFHGFLLLWKVILMFWKDSINKRFFSFFKWSCYWISFSKKTIKIGGGAGNHTNVEGIAFQMSFCSCSAVQCLTLAIPDVAVWVMFPYGDGAELWLLLGEKAWPFIRVFALTALGYCLCSVCVYFSYESPLWPTFPWSNLWVRGHLPDCGMWSSFPSCQPACPFL